MPLLTVFLALSLLEQVFVLDRQKKDLARGEVHRNEGIPEGFDETQLLLRIRCPARGSACASHSLDPPHIRKLHHYELSIASAGPAGGCLFLWALYLCLLPASSSCGAASVTH